MIRSQLSISPMMLVPLWIVLEAFTICDHVHREIVELDELTVGPSQVEMDLCINARS